MGTVGNAEDGRTGPQSWLFLSVSEALRCQHQYRNVPPGAVTLCPCPHLSLFCYTSKLIMMLTAIRKWERERRSEGLASALLPRSPPPPPLPCRCCSTQDSRRRISPTSAGKRISCNKGGINKTMMDANVIHLAHPCRRHQSNKLH